MKISPVVISFVIGLIFGEHIHAIRNNDDPKDYKHLTDKIDQIVKYIDEYRRFYLK